MMARKSTDKRLILPHLMHGEDGHDSRQLEGPGEDGHRAPFLRRWLRPFRRGTPTFEMHVIPRMEVEAVIKRSGGTLLHAIDDGAAGYRWLSYTYVARKA